ncbi:MAG TPA: F0F1 ATP synthase subunit B [Candidatus Paceibacterota bacterium]
MSALLSAFGLDWRLLLVNIINFGLLLFALWYFLYAPIMRILEERRAKVAQGVIDAQHAEEKLAEIEESRAGILSQAGQEADEVLANARRRGNEKEKELVASAEASAGRIVADAEAQAKELKAHAIAESKQEVAKLIVLGVEKVMIEKK